jgi:hypothetical protein
LRKQLICFYMIAPVVIAASSADQPTECKSCDGGGCSGTLQRGFFDHSQRANITALQQLLLFTWHCQAAGEGLGQQ